MPEDFVITFPDGFVQSRCRSSKQVTAYLIPYGSQSRTWATANYASSKTSYRPIGILATKQKSRVMSLKRNFLMNVFLLLNLFHQSELSDTHKIRNTTLYQGHVFFFWINEAKQCSLPEMFSQVDSNSSSFVDWNLKRSTQQSADHLDWKKKQKKL